MDQSYIKILSVLVEIYMHFVCIWGAKTVILVILCACNHFDTGNCLLHCL